MELEPDHSALVLLGPGVAELAVAGIDVGRGLQLPHVVELEELSGLAVTLVVRLKQVAVLVVPLLHVAAWEEQL